MKKYFKILFTFVLMFCFSSLVKADGLNCNFALFNVYNNLTEKYDVWFLNEDTQNRDIGSPSYENVGFATRSKIGNTCISSYDMNSKYVSNQFFGYVIGFYDNGYGSRIFLPGGQEQVFTLYLDTRAYNLYNSYGLRLEAYDSPDGSSRVIKTFNYSDNCKAENNTVGTTNFTYKCNFEYSFTTDKYLTFYVRSSSYMSNYLALSIGYSLNNYYENINDSINNATDKILQGQDKINDTLNSEDSDTSSKKCGVVCKLKGIWEGITNLPTLIVDKIKGLFVPDDFDFLTNFKDTLENKLGFIASIPIQVLDYLISLKDKVFTPITTIKFPKISIFGYYFWDEYTINTSDGLSWISSFKYFTDIGCVIICINTLRKWYSNFTGGDEK